MRKNLIIICILILTAVVQTEGKELGSTEVVPAEMFDGKTMSGWTGDTSAH